MKVLFSCVLLPFLAFLLVSCGAGSAPHLPSAAEKKEQGPDGVYHCRLTAGRQVRFSGLLGLGQRDGSLQYRLLDSSGITLLAGEVFAEHESCEGPLAKTQLKDVLPRALRRIFWMEPVESPCVGLWFRLCYETYDKGWRKEERIAGVVPVWRAKYDDDGLLYSLPFAGTQLFLQRITDDSASVEQKREALEEIE